MKMSYDGLIRIPKELAEAEKFILSNFPDERVAIIRGYDNFSYGGYTKGAYFDEEEAKRVMNGLPIHVPFGDCADTFHIVTGTVSELKEGNLVDRKTHKPLDLFDKLKVYILLQENLKN